MPKTLPARASANHIHPCRLPDAVPARNAPILHPKLSRAPIPINTPPSAAACNCLLFGHADLAKAPVSAAVNPEPMIIAKFIKLLVSEKTECASARFGPGHVQKANSSIGNPAALAIFAPHKVKPKVTPHGCLDTQNTPQHRNPTRTVASSIVRSIRNPRRALNQPKKPCRAN